MATSLCPAAWTTMSRFGVLKVSISLTMSVNSHIPFACIYCGALRTACYIRGCDRALLTRLSNCIILDPCAYSDMVEHVESSFQHNSNGATVFATKFLGSPKFSSYKVFIWPLLRYLALPHEKLLL